MGEASNSLISGTVLRWAREQRGMSLELGAKRLQLSVERLEEIETGLRQPSMAQLRHMADKYKRPLIVLLLDEPPTSFTALRDFRLLPDASRGVFSPELLDEIKRAELQQEVFAELKMQLSEQILKPLLPSRNGDVKALATKIRVFLGVSYASQKKWSDPRLALTEWRKRLEIHGILVLEASKVPMSEMRGFSLSSRLPLVMVLNGQDSPRGKVFTMLHELAHLCLRDPGVCDFRTDYREQTDIEIFCNAVAGESLFPTSDLEATSVFKNHSQSAPWSDFEINSLVGVGGGASEEVILRRLMDLGRLSRPEFDARVTELHKGYEQFRQDRRGKSKGGPAPYVMQLRDRGRPFIRSVFEAYADGHIDLSEVIDLAGVRTKHLTKLQHEAYL